jgi:ATP-binding cassette subfamily G (WHITE) protein 2 (SNQ2)
MQVGVELVAKPSLLFLDEPTSGLDSRTSFFIFDFFFLHSCKDNAKTRL